MLNYPNNHTGRTDSADRLRRLASVARRYRVVLLSDEIYGELNHAGTHVSIAEFYPEGTIISTGLSKWCGVGGWRLGTFTFPSQLKWLLEAMAVAASETYTAMSTPIQFAAVTAFARDPVIHQYLVQCRRVFPALGRHCATALQHAGLEVAAPEGGFYLFPDFRRFSLALRAKGISSSLELGTRLLNETGVATIPGYSCGRNLSELTLRMAYVDFNGADALDAVEKLGPNQELDKTFLRQWSRDPWLPSFWDTGASETFRPTPGHDSPWREVQHDGQGPQEGARRPYLSSVSNRDVALLCTRWRLQPRTRTEESHPSRRNPGACRLRLLPRSRPCRPCPADRPPGPPSSPRESPPPALRSSGATRRSSPHSAAPCGRPSSGR